MIDLTNLMNHHRILVESRLTPLQGHRIQPTGFPDLGAAVFTTPEGKDALLVESAQSMANRLEEVCWSKEDNDWIPELKGIPYIRVFEDDKFITNSVLESHRINSPYILESKDKTFFNMVKEELAGMERGAVDLNQLAKFLMKFDPGSIIHGVFIAKSDLAGGRLRISRSLSGFIEAENIKLAASGGVKLDRVDPQGNTKQGFGHVPFHRDEYTAEKITAYFNIDVAQIKSYGLDESATQFLITWALLKIRLFLDKGLRLRTACDLNAEEPVVTNIQNAEIPGTSELLESIQELITMAGDNFIDPPVTDVVYKAK